MNLNGQMILGFIPAAFVLVGAFAAGWVSAPALLLLGLAMLGGAIWCGTSPKERVSNPQVSETGSSVETPDDQTLGESDIIDALPGTVLILSTERRILAANQAARTYLGEGVVGRDLSMALRDPKSLKAADRVISGQRTCVNFSMTTSPPIRRHFEVQVQVLPDANPWKARAIYALHDITAVKEAEEMRADFVANVSHELRSPLTALIGFIETLQSSAKNDPKARERFLEIMDGEAQRMQRLIVDLLSLSRIEVSKHVRPEESVDVAALLKEVKDTLAPRGNDKGVEIKLVRGKKLEPVPGDRDQLTEVFHNLVDNAIKYGREGAPVQVKVAMMDDMPGIRRRGVMVAVRDQGDGIDPDKIPRLTERFYRVDKGRSRAIGGTGLGLAIVKHILKRHQGRMVVESEVGEGSTFTVYLPI